MGLGALCDVARVLLLDQASAADQAAALVGEEPGHVDSLLASLGEAEEGSRDADVIVLAEYKPQDLARELIHPEDVVAFNDLVRPQ